MKRIMKWTLACALSLALIVAGISWAILRPGAPQTVTSAASAGAVSNQAVPVSFKLPPDCSFQPTGAVIAASDARPVASFAAVPSGLSDAVSVEFPPCGQAQELAHPPQPDAGVAGVSFRILSIVRYQGTLGTVYVETTRPSSVALSRGVFLGDPGATLPDGSVTQVLQDVGSSPGEEVQWLKNGLVISVAGDLPSSQLEQMAASVAVR
jgi:hypothetical protein